jgi:hypothetical protein
VSNNARRARIERLAGRLADQGAGPCSVCGRAAPAAVAELLLAVRHPGQQPPPPPACLACGRVPVYVVIIERIVPLRGPGAPLDAQGRPADPDPDLPATPPPGLTSAQAVP